MPTDIQTTSSSEELNQEVINIPVLTDSQAAVQAMSSGSSSSVAVNEFSNDDPCCSICFDTLSDIINKPIVTLHDAHIFHVVCIASYRNARREVLITNQQLNGEIEPIPETITVPCPLCREPALPPKALFNQACIDFTALVGNETLSSGVWVARTEEEKNKMDKILEKWRSSAQQGDMRAQYILGQIYALGTGVKANLSESVKWYELSGNQGHENAFFSIGKMFNDGCAATPQDRTQAIVWFNRAAEQKNSEAMYCLATLYFHGEGVSLDLGEAYKWYLMGSEQGNAKSQFNLGNMFYRGQHVGVSFPEAFKYYMLAAKQNLTQSVFMVGSMYFSGKGVDVDYVKAIEYFEKASEQGFHIAQFKLGNMFYYANGAEKDFARAFVNYKKSALKGYAHAQLMMGIMCFFGEGTDKSYQEAAKWYQLAAEQNNILALLKLGSLYYSGRGMKKDYAKAIVYYEKAAALNSSDALLLLGNMHYDGKGYPKDISKAVDLYEKSALQNVASAQYRLGNIYYTGEGGVKQSYETAFSWYLKSANQGYLLAIMSVANMYFHGEYNGKDMTEAERWYLIGATKGSVNAQLSLGHVYCISKNYIKAIHWYSLAAKQRNAEAQFNLGLLHLKGLGVPFSIERAKEHFEGAAYRGHEGACFHMGEIFRNGAEPQKSVKWYYRASTLANDNEAELRLGEMFNKGVGVEQDDEEAIKWFQKSASHENESAIELLKAMSSKSLVIENAQENHGNVAEGGSSSLSAASLSSSRYESQENQSVFFAQNRRGRALSEEDLTRRKRSKANPEERPPIGLGS